MSSDLKVKKSTMILIIVKQEWIKMTQSVQCQYIRLVLFYCEDLPIINDFVTPFNSKLHSIKTRFHITSHRSSPDSLIIWRKTWQSEMKWNPFKIQFSNDVLALITVNGIKSQLGHFYRNLSHEKLGKRRLTLL